MTADQGIQLRDHPLFTGISDAEAELVLRDGHELRFEPGELIFAEGEATNGFYLIIAGSARIVATGARGETVRAIVHPGDVLGELGVLDGQARTARAHAIGFCGAYFIPSEPFLDVLEQSPAVCLRLLALLTRRLRYANGRLGELAGTQVVDGGLP